MRENSPFYRIKSQFQRCTCIFTLFIPRAVDFLILFVGTPVSSYIAKGTSIGILLISLIRYPLTAPKVSPFTRYR